MSPSSAIRGVIKKANNKLNMRIFLSKKMVGMEGVEPPRLTALVPKTSVSTSSTTSPEREIISQVLKRK